jgi:AcrR family transcriptional regulator
MPRPKSVPDDHVLFAIAAIHAQGGDKAVTFASVSAATGLAPPTLVQRYRSRDGMMDWALNRAWTALEKATVDALPVLANKGSAAFLKALTGAGLFPLAALVAEGRSPELRDRAALWRETIESRLAQAMGNPRSRMEPARIAFAAWQGQLLWEAAGGKGFRLKDALRRIG